MRAIASFSETAKEPASAGPLVAVAKRYTQLFQVRVGEIGQQRCVDVGLHEGRAILAEPETLQPLDDRLRRVQCLVLMQLNSTAGEGGR